MNSNECNECVICRENFTNILRRRITCDACKAVSCFKCFNTYLNEERECMFCHQEIQWDFIKTHLSNVKKTKVFNKIIEEDFKNQEQLLGPTQVRLKRENTLECLKMETNRLLFELRSIHIAHENGRPLNIERILAIKKRNLEIEGEVQEIEKFINQSVEEIQKTSFKCPISDCLGVVSGRAMKCVMCLKEFCNLCQSEKLEDHECDPDELKTVQFISLDSKPCPKCHVPIHKTEGCNQMFCVHCKTIFDWETLKIHEKGFVHNPHYFEYLNANGAPLVFANEDQDPCQADLRSFIILMRGETKFAETICTDTNDDPKTKVWREIATRNIIPQMINGSAAIIEQLRNDITEQNVEETKTRLRETYLKTIDVDAFVSNANERYKIYEKKISPEKALKIWQKSFALFKKQNEVKRDLIQLLDLFKTLISESVIVGYRTKKYPEMFESITQHIDYFNAQLKKKNNGLTYKTQITSKNGVQCHLVRV